MTIEPDSLTRIAILEREVETLKEELRRQHGYKHEIGGDDPIRPSVQSSATQLNRQRTINFSTGLTATEDADNKRVNITVDESAVDHGGLGGLSDDDHTQYLLAAGSRAGASSQAQDFGSYGVKADVVAESTADTGVTIDGLLVKDTDVQWGQREQTILVVASDAKNVSQYTQITGKVYVCDGTADDVQINAAIAALPSNEGRVVLTEGTFDITATITLGSRQILEGQGRATVLEIPSGTAVLPAIKMQGSAGSHVANSAIKNLFVNAAGTDANGGVLSDHVSYLRMYGVTIANMEGYAVRIEATWDSEFVSCQFSNSGTASIPNAYILNASDDGCNNLTFLGCRFEGFDGVGVQVEQVSGATCRAHHFIGCKIHARTSPTDIDSFVIKGASNIEIMACNFGETHTDHPDLKTEDSGSESADEIIIIGNQFRSTSPTFHIDLQGGDRSIIDCNLFETEPDTHHIKVGANCDGTVIGSSNVFAAGAATKVLDNNGTNTKDLYHWEAFHDVAEATISSGAITATQRYMFVDTEGDAAADDLDTVNGGQGGMILVLSQVSNNRDVTLKDGTGNLKLAGDFAIDFITETITLVYNDQTDYWYELCRSSND